MRLRPLSLVVAALASGPALAAGMPVKAPVAYYDWSGFYVGGSIGFAAATDPITMATASGAGFPVLGAGTALYGLPQQFILAPDGTMFGLQGGYNWQTSSNIVVGVEADIQFGGLHARRNCIIPCGAQIATVPLLGLTPVVFSDISVAHSLNWLGTLRGRIGHPAGPFLLYATAGLAFGSLERSGSVVGATVGAITGTVFNTFAGGYTNSSTLFGWALGFGAEGRLWGNWSAKAEYLYVDLGSVTDSFNTIYTTSAGAAVVGTVAATRTETTSFSAHLFRVGLNYHLNARNPAFDAFAAVSPPPPFRGWSGFYLGGSIGFGKAITDTTMTTASGAGFPLLPPGTTLYGGPQAFELAPGGLGLGVQAGYNWQAAPRFLIGAEADFMLGGTNDEIFCIIPCTAPIATVSGLPFSVLPVVFSDISASHNVNWLATLRARLGVTSGPFVVYGTAGLAIAEVERNASVVGSTVAAVVGFPLNTFAGRMSNTSTLTGWTAGIGAEGRLNGNWSAKAEYLYVDLGSVTDVFSTIFTTSGAGAVAGTVAATRTSVTTVREHIFRLGLNYHLGAPAPGN